MNYKQLILIKIKNKYNNINYKIYNLYFSISLQYNIIVGV